MLIVTIKRYIRANETQNILLHSPKLFLFTNLTN